MLSLKVLESEKKEEIFLPYATEVILLKPDEKGVGKRNLIPLGKQQKQMKLYPSPACFVTCVCLCGGALKVLKKCGRGCGGSKIQTEQNPIPSHTENIHCWLQALFGGNQTYDIALEHSSSFSFSSSSSLSSSSSY